MINRKGSISISFLIISILIISSGIIVTQEFITSNNENNAKTGLVLLNEVQYIEENQIDNFEDEVVDNSFSFTINKKDVSKSSSKSSRSKKSSSGSSSSSSSSNSDSGDNETNLVSDYINSSVNISDEEIMTNTSESLEGIEVKSIIDPNVIWFTQAPPSSICYNFNEVVDTISLGLGTVNLKWGIFNSDYISCKLNGRKDVLVTYCLIEYDPVLSDDVIKCGYATATTYDCSTLNLENYRGYIIKREFTNVKLSDQFDESGEGSIIEVYAKVYSPNNYFNSYKTSNYNVYKKICDCLSGPCCDLSTNKFKPYGSQPTGYSDTYDCSGTNSPTGTNYVVRIDYYCNGVSASAKYSESNYDKCGTCEYCTRSDSTCNYYSSSVKCGTYDCNYLENTWPCKDYGIVDKHCNGVGSCIHDPCTWTNKPKGTSCGTNKECDGNGNCISACECSSGPCCDGCNYKANGAQPTGYTDDTNGFCKGTNGATSISYVYTRNYYCNGNDANEHHTDTKKDTCGTCEYCTNNDLTCNYYSSSTSCGTCKKCNGIGSCSDIPADDSGCGVIDCSSWYVKSGTQDPITTQYCYNKKDITSNRCEAFGNCKDSNTADCNSQSNDQQKYSCGVCKYISSSSCSGTTLGSCSNYAQGTSCGTNKECDGYGSCITCTSQDYYSCSDNDVYWYDACGNKEEKKTECGSDSCDSWLNFCKNDDVHKKRTCYDRGCSSDACFDIIYVEEEKVQDCGTSEYTGSNYCYDDEVYRDYITRGCSDSGCTSFTSKKKIEDCEHGCTEGRCKVEVCEIVCNFGICKTYCVWQ